ncbi:DUF3696 domain-containing protein [Vibrio sp. B172a]|uniref:DUF3696 domain-containing protein n=1 Tax=Vibrio sp. B172a TaxID=2835790 RepID=UPI002552B899|nr:DUF3696 domain-containing protein [Vibrio sp. B172a]MDK9781563.1 DUF3696 domain-containing protein [Vibrio sp. B172a]
MIEHIKLTNFKCYKDASFNMSNLSVFCGNNSVGKSTVIQSILLLIQNDFSSSLRLDGDFIKLVGYKEVHNIDADTDSLLVRAIIDGNCLSWGYERDPLSEGEKSVNLLSFSESMDLELASSIANEVKEKYKNNFNFLCAERWGPRDNYPYSNQRRSKSWLGIHGEYTAQVLTNLLESSKSLDEGDPRIHDKITSRLVIDNFTAWMGEISPGTFVKSDSITHANISTNQFVFDNHTYRATNVGFGLSYALPVVLSLVMARPGGLVIIENPEAHLHPRGQSYLGRLIALTALAGVQVILETHSDHIINGIRVATRLDERFPDELARIFFVTAGDGESKVEELSVSEDGELPHWPVGFFDQQALDVRSIMLGENITEMPRRKKRSSEGDSRERQ